MPPSQYGVVKRAVLGHPRDADDDHCQILVKVGNTLHRLAVNAKSVAPNSLSILRFQTTTTVPANLKAELRALRPGYQKLSSKPDRLAQDYVRGGIVKPATMILAPMDVPGLHDDSKDKLEDAAVKAMALAGSLVYAFGQQWGPEAKKADQYF